MKKIIFVLTAGLLLFSSCAGKPEPKAEEPIKKPVVQETPVKPEPKPEPVVKKTTPPVVEKSSDNEVIAEFDGVEITKKDKAKAKSEIEVVVSKLNKITDKKDYAHWYTFLSDDYISRFSNPRELKSVSKRLPGIYKGVKLKNLNDYFTYVFVPSRQRCRVDDIKYLSPTKVRVIKKYKGKDLVFYNLKKIGNKWLLVP